MEIAGTSEVSLLSNQAGIRVLGKRLGPLKSGTFSMGKLSSSFFLSQGRLSSSCLDINRRNFFPLQVWVYKFT